MQIPLLEQEHANVLNALQWLLATDQGEAAVRLSSTLWFFWWMRGLLEEGPAFLEQALATSGGIPRAVRAKGLAAAGFFASHYDNLQHAEALLSESTALLRELEDVPALSLALRVSGYVACGRAISQPDLARVRLLVEEAVVHSRARNYLYNLAQGLFLPGLIVLWQGETATAEVLFMECLQLPQQPFYWSFMVLSTGCLGAIAGRQGGVEQTYAPLEQYRVIDKESITPSNVATYILGVAAAVAVQGEPGEIVELADRAQ